MRMKRFSEFLLKEQEEGGGDGQPYVSSPEQILQLPSVSDSLSELEASVDQKIDKYLMQFERESVPLDMPEVDGALPVDPAQVKDNVQTPPLTERKREKRLFSMGRFLFEQEAPPEPPADDAGGMGDMDMGGGDDPFGGVDDGGDDTESNPPEVVPVPKINIRKFAEGVARLVNNYQTLIDPKSLILNRAMFYISKNYSPRLAKEMVNILERDFDLTAKTKKQVQGDYPAAPRAGNSGPDNGGGVPSGGGSVGSSTSSS